MLSVLGNQDRAWPAGDPPTFECFPAPVHDLALDAEIPGLWMHAEVEVDINRPLPVRRRNPGFAPADDPAGRVGPEPLISRFVEVRVAQLLPHGLDRHVRLAHQQVSRDAGAEQIADRLQVGLSAIAACLDLGLDCHFLLLGATSRRICDSRWSGFSLAGFSALNRSDYTR